MMETTSRLVPGTKAESSRISVWRHVGLNARLFRGAVSCKHVQTTQTNNLQTKQPVAGAPGKTGNTTSSVYHEWGEEDGSEQTRQSSFPATWVTAHLCAQRQQFVFFAYLQRVGLHTNTSPALTQTETAGELQSQVIFFYMLKIYHSVRKCNIGNEARQRVLWCDWISTNEINTSLNSLGFNKCDTFC